MLKQRNDDGQYISAPLDEYPFLKSSYEDGVTWSDKRIKNDRTTPEEMAEYAKDTQAELNKIQQEYEQS